MNGHRPVFWSQGLFLHPQHFQAADEAVERQIEPLRRHVLPFFWGLRRMELRNAALERFAVEIDGLEAVFPSGAVVSVPFDASIAPLALDDTWPGPDAPGILYLGLALPDKAGENAAPEGGQAGRRFVFANEPELLPDVYAAGPPAPVERLRYAPVLFRDRDRERYGNFEALPIASLSWAGERIQLDPHFLPPLLCLDASPRLSGMLQEIQNLALSCAGRLAGYKITAGAEGYEADLRFVLNFTALGILNRYIPALDHLRAAPHAHPWQAYGLLRQLIGELSSFSDEVDCLGRGTHTHDALPDYDHEKLRECFEAAQGLIQQLLAGLGADAARVLPLQPAPPYFTATAPDTFFSPSGRYWLTVRARNLPDRLAEELPRTVKLGAGERLGTLIAKAVSGIPLTRVSSPPPGFVRERNSAWYAVDAAHPLWREAQAQMKVSLFWEDAPEDAQAQLVATGR